MRSFVRGLSVVLVAGMVSACSCPSAKPGGAAATTQADQAAGGCVMQSVGVSVLRMTPMPGIRCAAADGLLRFVAPKYEVEVWLVPGAQTVDEAVGRAPTQIVGEFKDFKPDHATDLTVAGSPAKELVGPGHEADDGDDGSADVIVFKVGDHVFVGCNHDEKLTAAGQQGLAMLVQTARVP